MKMMMTMMMIFFCHHLIVMWNLYGPRALLDTGAKSFRDDHWEEESFWRFFRRFFFLLLKIGVKDILIILFLLFSLLILRYFFSSSSNPLSVPISNMMRIPFLSSFDSTLHSASFWIIPHPFDHFLMSLCYFTLRNNKRKKHIIVIIITISMASSSSSVMFLWLHHHHLHYSSLSSMQSSAAFPLSFISGLEEELSTPSSTVTIYPSGVIIMMKGGNGWKKISHQKEVKSKTSFQPFLRFFFYRRRSVIIKRSDTKVRVVKRERIFTWVSLSFLSWLEGSWYICTCLEYHDERTMIMYHILILNLLLPSFIYSLFYCTELN